MSTLLEKFIPGAIERSKTDLTKLSEQEAVLTERRQATLDSIKAVDLPAGAADDVELAIQSARRATAAQQEVCVIENSIAIWRLRRVEAITKQRQSEASELREKAAELRNQAGRIRAKVEPLLAKLGELQSVPYDMRLCVLQPNTTVFDGGLFRPRSVALDYEAAELEEKAGLLDKSGVMSSGRTVGALEQILATEAFRDPWQLAPPAHELKDWVDRLEAQIQKQFGLNTYRRTYRLEWREGKIDLDNSNVEVDNEDYNRAGANPTFRVGV